jgi:hypothetical protein
MGLTDKEATIYLDFAEEFLESIELAEHKRIAAAEGVEAKLEKTSGIQAMMVRVLMPAYARVISMDLSNRAQLRAARVGVAIERYRLANGKLPENLAELVPAYLDAVPKDPFDGQELRYKRLEKGYVVYSIGEDGSDDGGKERLPQGKRKGATESSDVTFIVER